MLKISKEDIELLWKANLTDDWQGLKDAVNENRTSLEIDNPDRLLSKIGDFEKEKEYPESQDDLWDLLSSE